LRRCASRGYLLLVLFCEVQRSSTISVDCDVECFRDRRKYLALALNFRTRITQVLAECRDATYWHSVDWALSGKKGSTKPCRAKTGWALSDECSNRRKRQVVEDSVNGTATSWNASLRTVGLQKVLF